MGVACRGRVPPLCGMHELPQRYDIARQLRLDAFLALRIRPIRKPLRHGASGSPANHCAGMRRAPYRVEHDPAAARLHRD
jgi:hypothetical protein